MHMMHILEMNRHTALSKPLCYMEMHANGTAKRQKHPKCFLEGCNYLPSKVEAIHHNKPLTFDVLSLDVIQCACGKSWETMKVCSSLPPNNPRNGRSKTDGITAGNHSSTIL